MVILVVSKTTEQLWHQSRWSSRSVFVRASRAPSKYSFSSFKISVHFTLRCLHCGLYEEAVEPFAQLQPRAQQPRLHRRNAQFERLGRFFRRQTFYITQNEYRTEPRGQPLDRTTQ